MNKKKELRKWDIGKTIRNYATVEYGMVLAAGVAASGLLGYLCYDSLIGSLCCLPFSLALFPAYRRWKEDRRVNAMRMEFKDLLYTLASGLRAGYSMENAWFSAEQDMKLLYPERGVLQNAVHTVSNKLHINVPIESAVSEMARECGLEEIDSFAESLMTAKRSGGNLAQMMDKIASIIAEKMEVDQEIQTMLSGKKMEQRIMSGMPVAMLLYMRLTNHEYIGGLYHNGMGILIVTGCMLTAAAAYIWGDHIIQIKV
ncbi:MAG: type II secretion system F family protein [Lachnospiraceae bacterium]|nr:type II secretion system F family protein [Lachnospiraceae bacterium]